MWGLHGRSHGCLKTAFKKACDGWSACLMTELRMSTLTYKFFKSAVAVASYVCHILGHSVCLQFTRQSISACSSRHSLQCLIFLTGYCKAASWHWTFCTERWHVVNGRNGRILNNICVTKFERQHSHDECLMLVHDYDTCSSYQYTYIMCTLLVPQIQLLSCQAILLQGSASLLVNCYSELASTSHVNFQQTVSGSSDTMLSFTQKVNTMTWHRVINGASARCFQQKICSSHVSTIHTRNGILPSTDWTWLHWGPQAPNTSSYSIRCSGVWTVEVEQHWCWNTQSRFAAVELCTASMNHAV